MQQPNRLTRRSARIAHYLLATPPGQRTLAAALGLLSGVIFAPFTVPPSKILLAVLFQTVIGYGFCAYMQALDRGTDWICRRFLRRRRPQSTTEDDHADAAEEEDAP